MKNLYLSGCKKRQLIFTAVYLFFISGLNAQVTTCSNAIITTCTGGNVSQNFDASSGGFSPSGGTSGSVFVYTGPAVDGDFTVGLTVKATTYILTSGNYTQGSPGAAPSVGFSLAGSTVGINDITVQILNTSNVVIAECAGVTAVGDQVCITLTDADLVQGSIIRYQILITTGNGNSNDNKILKFDDFADGPTNATVPVRLTHFSASKDNNKVKLFWKVDAESKLSGYEVERSSNGANFQKIGFVNATGAGNYNFTDFAPLAGVNFYRLRSIDNDSKFIYSFVVSVNGRQGLFINKFPNPAIKNLTVQHPQASGTAILRITSLDGKLVKQLKLPMNSVQTVVDVSGLLAGNYVVEFVSGTDRVNSTFVKH